MTHERFLFRFYLCELGVGVRFWQPEPTLMCRVRKRAERECAENKPDSKTYCAKGDPRSEDWVCTVLERAKREILNLEVPVDQREAFVRMFLYGPHPRWCDPGSARVSNALFHIKTAVELKFLRACVFSLQEMISPLSHHAYYPLHLYCTDNHSCVPEYLDWIKVDRAFGFWLCPRKTFVDRAEFVPLALALRHLVAQEFGEEVPEKWYDLATWCSGYFLSGYTLKFSYPHLCF